VWQCSRFHALQKSYVELLPRVSPKNHGNNGTGREDKAVGAQDGNEETPTAAAYACSILQQ